MVCTSVAEMSQKCNTAPVREDGQLHRVPFCGGGLSRQLLPVDLDAHVAAGRDVRSAVRLHLRQSGGAYLAGGRKYSFWGVVRLLFARVAVGHDVCYAVQLHLQQPEEPGQPALRLRMSYQLHIRSPNAQVAARHGVRRSGSTCAARHQHQPLPQAERLKFK